MQFNDPKDLFAIESRYKEELFIIHYNRNIILQDEKSYNHNLNLVMEFLNQCIHKSYYDENYTELKPSLTTIYKGKHPNNIKESNEYNHLGTLTMNSI